MTQLLALIEGESWITGREGGQLPIVLAQRDPHEVTVDDGCRHDEAIEADVYDHGHGYGHGYGWPEPVNDLTRESLLKYYYTWSMKHQPNLMSWHGSKWFVYAHPTD